MRKLGRLGKLWLIFLTIFFCLATSVQAGPITLTEDVSQFGNLSQYNTIITDAYGNFGCQVTAFVNAFVYLQKTYPSIYGTKLVADYSSTTLANAAVVLGKPWNMNVQVTRNGNNITNAFSSGGDIIWGVSTYIENRVPGQTDYAAQMISPRTGPGIPSRWTTARPKPDWVSESASYPTEAFLYNALSRSQALVITWNQLNSDGTINFSGKSHVLTVTGLTWDSSTDRGTLFFVDPVGGQHNSPFWQAGNGALWIDYGESLVNGVETPWEKSDGITNWWFSGKAQLMIGMAEGPAPIPLPSTLLLLGSGFLGMGASRRFRKG